MAYCSKCGIELEKGWVHCPACGEEVVKTAKAKEPKIEIQPTKSKSPEILAAIDDERSIFNTKIEVPPARTKSQINEFRRYLLATGIILLCLLLISSFSNGSPESNSGTSAEDVALEQTQQDIQYEGVFLNTLADFQKAGCAAKIKKDTVPELGYQMELDVPRDVEYMIGEPHNYPFNQDREKVWKSWGNSAERVLVMNAGFQYEMSWLYWHIFDLYEDDGMGQYKEQFNLYLNFLKKMSAQLCNKAPFTEDELLLADGFIRIIDEWYPEFEAWVIRLNDDIDEISNGISDRLKDFNTPKCKEYPTDNPNFNIVKCTNLP